MEKWILQMRKKLPLEVKVRIAQNRLLQFCEHFDYNVYISFSGGLNSTVLAHMALNHLPHEVPLVIVNHGMLYPGICEQVEWFRNSMNANIVTLIPRQGYRSVIKKYGYPVCSKRVSRYIYDLRRPWFSNYRTQNLRLTGFNSKGQYCSTQLLPKKWLPLVDTDIPIHNKCCDVLKKEPFKRYEKLTGRIRITGETAGESNDRDKDYIKYGCNVFDSDNPRSKPLQPWTHQDNLKYLLLNNVPIPSCYGEIREKNGILTTTKETRTGCMYCMYGVHMEKSPNRFERMKNDYPKHYTQCIDTFGQGRVLDAIGVSY